MLIQSARPIRQGSLVEILRGEQLIIARVVWSEAGKSGLRSDERLPVEEILSLEHSRSLQLIASNGLLHDRRRAARRVFSEAREQGRLFEFLAVGVFAVIFAVGLWSVTHQAISGPMAAVSTALGN